MRCISFGFFFFSPSPSASPSSSSPSDSCSSFDDDDWGVRGALGVTGAVDSEVEVDVGREEASLAGTTGAGAGAPDWIVKSACGSLGGVGGAPLPVASEGASGEVLASINEGGVSDGKLSSTLAELSAAPPVTCASASASPPLGGAALPVPPVEASEDGLAAINEAGVSLGKLSSTRVELSAAPPVTCASPASAAKVPLGGVGAPVDAREGEFAAMNEPGVSLGKLSSTRAEFNAVLPVFANSGLLTPSPSESASDEEMKPSPVYPCLSSALLEFNPVPPVCSTLPSDAAVPDKDELNPALAPVLKFGFASALDSNQSLLGEPAKLMTVDQHHG
ncbi:hypothetical protein DFH06DRAFT_1151678 [Mycena polygramma]|nr:hypothetical protein DFH06DRAFT_1151678 [Mycena polygramma]